MQEKTIAAISTPSGTGGIGIIRISGENAIDIADKVFKSISGKKLSSLKGYQAAFGKIIFEDEVIDNGVALVFRAPKSYTGEDVVELSVHGGNYVLKEVLRAVLASGAQSASGGEFTRRAYLNGKLDLMEAEAVMGIISAEGKTASRAAYSLHDGAAHNKIKKIKESLLTAAAGLAVFSDYPDDELPEFSDDTLTGALKDAKLNLEELLRTYDAGKILREGVDTVIAGKPNVGKSTLMNLLSGCKRSIVTSIAGTTRDIVEESVLLKDIKLRLSDTAGLRETDDEVEKIGVSLSRERINFAGLILAVFDRSEKETDEDLKLIEICKERPSIAIINKNDLESKFNETLLEDIPKVIISAKDENSIKEIEEAVATVCGTYALDGTETILCSERQRDCCAEALRYITEALDVMMSGFTLDAVGVCIDDALSQLLSLTGERVTNAVVDEVFSKFCVGK